MTTETFIERAQALIDSRFEYETTHQDAGDNYAHMASDGDFDYHNGESRLQEYCEEMGIDLSGVDIDKLAEDVIFWGYMVQGHDFDPQKRFLVSSYNVGEIEVELSADDLGLDRITESNIDALNKSCDAYFRPGVRSLGTSCDYAYAYINASDNYWDHVCDADTIRDLVEQHKGG